MTNTKQFEHDVQCIEKLPTARKDEVDTLYKFMSYPPDNTDSRDNIEQRRRVVSLLRDGELYFPWAKQMNDPFEAAPHFRIPGITDEKGVADFRRKWSEYFKSDIPMCCLSASRCSTLMWSYYSDGHKGICIHIDATKKPFGDALRVNYDSQYPEIFECDGKLVHDLDELLKRMLLTKSEVWDHECEYRLINLPMAESEPPLYDQFEWKTSRRAIIPLSFIVGVTVGAGMADQEIEEITRICNECLIKIPVFKAKCRQDRFDLEFSQITQ